MGVDGKTYTYTYNAEGLRVAKTVDGVVHTYYYDETELLMEKWGNCYLRFAYDEQGRPFRVDYYNGTTVATYYYVLNLQGDVIEIRNDLNNVVCKYSYDAWGKILSIKDGSGNTITAAGHIGNLNPLRYRGYYYDSETGLYYVLSRYYDPEIGRFINADSQLNIGEGVLGCNMYTYCLNNPVNGYDSCGTCFHRWDFWNDCDKCGGKNLRTKIVDAVSAVGSAVVSARKEVCNAVVSAGKAIGNTAVFAWNWTKGAAQTAWGGVKAAGKAVGNFVVDRFSTPEKASNTLSAIGFTLDVAAVYCGGVAAGLSIPTLGMSIPTAGTAAAILAIASLPFHGAALVIDIFTEE